jgi:hypothetical protein
VLPASLFLPSQAPPSPIDPGRAHSGLPRNVSPAASSHLCDEEHDSGTGQQPRYNLRGQPPEEDVAGAGAGDEGHTLSHQNSHKRLRIELHDDPDPPPTTARKPAVTPAGMEVTPSLCACEDAGKFMLAGHHSSICVPSNVMHAALPAMLACSHFNPVMCCLAALQTRNPTYLVPACVAGGDEGHACKAVSADITRPCPCSPCRPVSRPQARQHPLHSWRPHTAPLCEPSCQ